MPSQTDHQLAADAFYCAFLINLIAEIEAWELYESNSNSDSEEDKNGLCSLLDTSSLDDMDTSE